MKPASAVSAPAHVFNGSSEVRVLGPPLVILPSCCCLLIYSEQVNSCFIYVNSPLKTSLADQSLQSVGESRLEERTELGHCSESPGEQSLILLTLQDHSQQLVPLLSLLAAACPQSLTLSQEQQPDCFASRIGRVESKQQGHDYIC